MDSQDFTSSPYLAFHHINNDDDSCLEKVHLSDLDAWIFWIGGSILFILSFFLILGSIRFKELRKQPGDLILGVAISDLILSTHWILLASYRELINNYNFCQIVGAVGTFGGINAFIYNSAFSLFLIVSLRNAIKQSKIPKYSFHFICLFLSSAYLIYLIIANDIGKTLVGTCSIKSKCTLSFYNFFGSAVSILYAIFGTFTYFYVKRNMPVCSKAASKRTRFLAYYQTYNIVCTLSYFFIATTNILDTILNEPHHHENTVNFVWINTLYNIAKVTSPLILTLIRFNDPTIKKFVWKTIFFKRRDSNYKEVREALMSQDLISANPSTGNGHDLEDNDKMNSFSSNEFVFNQLSSNRRVEMTFTLIACVMFGNIHRTRRISPEDPLTVRKTSDKSRRNPYKHEEVYLIEERTIAQDIPEIKTEAEFSQYGILSGTLKVYAPAIFDRLLSKDRKLDIMETLDFAENREQITLASKPMGGKSGEFFFFSKDKKLIIKTISDSELNMLNSILKEYENHYEQYPNSLITKIYGAFTYENTDMGLKYNLILMKNVCGCPSSAVERIYDMKGSTYDRQVLKGNEFINKDVLRSYVLKDADFEKYEKKLFIEPGLKEKVLEQIKADSIFLKNANLIDYSMMVFIVIKQSYKCSGEDDQSGENPLATITNQNEPDLMYKIGIIDFLTPYSFKKIFERCFKKARKLNPNLDTSSQKPDVYSERFIQFVNKLIA